MRKPEPEDFIYDAADFTWPETTLDNITEATFYIDNGEPMPDPQIDEAHFPSDEPTFIEVSSIRITTYRGGRVVDTQVETEDDFNSWLFQEMEDARSIVIFKEDGRTVHYQKN